MVKTKKQLEEEKEQAKDIEDFKLTIEKIFNKYGMKLEDRKELISLITKAY